MAIEQTLENPILSDLRSRNLQLLEELVQYAWGDIGPQRMRESYVNVVPDEETGLPWLYVFQRGEPYCNFFAHSEKNGKIGGGLYYLLDREDMKKMREGAVSLNPVERQIEEDRI